MSHEKLKAMYLYEKNISVTTRNYPEQQRQCSWSKTRRNSTYVSSCKSFPY